MLVPKHYISLLLVNETLCAYGLPKACIFEQSMHEDGLAGVFISALMVANQELLCVTADQEFLFYLLECKSELLELTLTKRLVGYSKGVNDVKFIGIDEKFIAVAANLEHVWKFVFYLDLKML
ncbi:hypothetical protein OROGR_011372 [Orobanche gracilis]